MSVATVSMDNYVALLREQNEMTVEMRRTKLEFARQMRETADLCENASVFLRDSARNLREMQRLTDEIIALVESGEIA